MSCSLVFILKNRLIHRYHLWRKFRFVIDDSLTGNCSRINMCFLIFITILSHWLFLLWHETATLYTVLFNGLSYFYLRAIGFTFRRNFSITNTYHCSTKNDIIYTFIIKSQYFYKITFQDKRVLFLIIIINDTIIKSVKSHIKHESEENWIYWI